MTYRTARHQRLAELIAARARLDSQIRTLAAGLDDPTAAPALIPPPPTNADWITTAHRNQIHLDLLGPHVRHARRTAA